MLARDALVALLDEHAPFSPCPLVPGLCAWHTDDEIPLWRALEAAAGHEVGVPYFAIAWPAAQVLAGAILDHVVDVRARRVADVGCGSGLVATAAMKAGARSALALDVDAFAVQAAATLAERHGVRVEARVLDPLAAPDDVEVDLVVCADLVSRAAQAQPFAAAVSSWRARGAEVVLVDSGRPFFDPQGLPLAFEREVPAASRVDGAGMRRVRVFRAR